MESRISKKAQAQLKTYRQSVLKHAFEGKLTEEWRKENNPEPADKLFGKNQGGTRETLSKTAGRMEKRMREGQGRGEKEAGKTKKTPKGAHFKG